MEALVLYMTNSSLYSSVNLKQCIFIKYVIANPDH